MCDRTIWMRETNGEELTVDCRRSSPSRIRNRCFQFGYAVIFAVGQAKTLSGNDAVNYEASIYGDILQSDFIDAYRNLTLKSIAAFRYVAVTCPNARAVVKLNDVIGWNIENSKPIIANAIEDGKIHCSR
ncbi:hypothetical protein COOONC_11053 [Cooperia oncophora]